ncbi:hypothetical protein DLAC_07285 [Tieghemostelium lacteum]|uniref:Uncharacterized protein n=1 Tax=Tieghemostelium lacteum TaxID=361077 RepID=A0A151ZC51_TIELA|nr:hypothetical protein DLAC_07285 [Tieghemostelium lacteum]|eukprot:KYQ91526.1 hypothetical protein DLAC_07285 [Tieghemostelium lacteum]
METPKILILKIIQTFIDIYDTKGISFRKWILGTLLLLSKEFSNDIVRKLYWKQRFDILQNDHLEIYKKISSKTMGFTNVQVEGYNYSITDISYHSIEELSMLGCCESITLKLEHGRNSGGKLFTKVKNMLTSIKIGENRDDVIKELKDCPYSTLRNSKSYYPTQKSEPFSLVDIIVDIINSSKVIENVTIGVLNIYSEVSIESMKLQKVKSLQISSSEASIVDSYNILPFIQLQGNLERFHLDIRNREMSPTLTKFINQPTFFTNGFRNLKSLSISSMTPGGISPILKLALIEYLNSDSSKTLEFFNTNLAFSDIEDMVVYPTVSNDSIHTLQVNIFLFLLWQTKHNIVDLVLDFSNYIGGPIKSSELTALTSLYLQINNVEQCKSVPQILQDIPQLKELYLYFGGFKSMNLEAISETIILHPTLKLISFQKQSGSLIGDEVNAIAKLFNFHHKTLTTIKLIFITLPNEILPSIYNNTNITHLQLDKCISDDVEFLMEMLSKNSTIEHLYVESRYFGNPFNLPYNVQRVSQVINKNNTIKTLNIRDDQFDLHFGKLFIQKAIQHKMDITNKRNQLDSW